MFLRVLNLWRGFLQKIACKKRKKAKKQIANLAKKYYNHYIIRTKQYSHNYKETVL